MSSAAGSQVLTELYVLDADVHVHEQPAEMAEYAGAPWDISLREIAKVPERYLDLPGLSPNAIYTPPFPGDTERSQMMATAAEMREGLDGLDVDDALLLPDHLLFLAKVQVVDFAAAVAGAYNRWLAERWLQEEPTFKGALVIAPQDPTAAAKEIRAHGGNDKWAGIYLPAAGVRPLYGHRSYNPIYEAAVEFDLPVLIHSAATVHPTFPFQLEVFETWMAQHVFAHPLAVMSNLVSMLETGVFERFPSLRVGVMEAGVSWVPFLMYRLDKHFMEIRRQMPYLSERPSDYLRRCFYGTQPIEEPASAADLITIIDLFDGENQVVFASDWPHHDFDHTKAVSDLPFSPEARRKVLGENALRLLRMTPSRTYA